jgi:hypothetical protein
MDEFTKFVNANYHYKTEENVESNSRKISCRK